MRDFEIVRCRLTNRAQQGHRPSIRHSYTQPHTTRTVILHKRSVESLRKLTLSPHQVLENLLGYPNNGLVTE